MESREDENILHCCYMYCLSLSLSLSLRKNHHPTFVNMKSVRDIVVMYPQSCYDDEKKNDNDASIIILFFKKKGDFSWYGQQTSGHVLRRLIFVCAGIQASEDSNDDEQAAVGRTAVWLLVLLVSNECITVSNAIKERLQMNENAYHRYHEEIYGDDFGLNHLENLHLKLTWQQKME